MDLSLFLVAGAGISLLLFLVMALRVPAFLALLITSLCVGLLSGLQPEQVIDSVKTGMRHPGLCGYCSGPGSYSGSNIRELWWH